MIEQDEALAIGRRLFNEQRPAGEQCEAGVYAFDAGYVLWAEEPPPADPARPPDTVGTGCLVVDRISGAVSYWPPLPAVLIAQRYAGRPPA